MEHPEESLKSLANRIAKAATTEDGTHLARLLRTAGFLGYPPSPSSRQFSLDDIGHDDSIAEEQLENIDRVGIWERKKGNGQEHFVRCKDMAGEFHHWSGLARIEPKEKKTRVVLIGESVARGYLYDPVFNPAMALEAMLRSQFGNDDVEVIDLARTNLGLEVRELAISALLVDPDLVIIFSGNNWGVSAIYENTHIPEIEASLRENGIPRLKQLIESQLEEKVKRLVKDVASAYESKGIPLLWMIPEFNLADWKDPATNAPHLAEGANQEWIALRQLAETALQNKDFLSASEFAEKMVELDQGVIATGLYILAECSRSSGMLDDARRYLESARDASIWQISLSPPRAYSTTQKTLRKEAKAWGNGLVDLPELFREHFQKEIPGRRLFLDYCHLTAEGIVVAMAGAAAEALKTLQGSEVPWQLLADDCTLPSREAQAEASFLASIHNAHFWQPYELVHYHCLRAVQSSPLIAPLMRDFLDLQVRCTPMLMCRAAEHIAKTASQTIQSYLLGLNTQQLDPILLDAIVESLNTVSRDDGARLAHHRLQEHSIRHRAVNLLDYYYCSATLKDQEVMWVLPRDSGVAYKMSDYYKAYWIESKFIFVGEADSLAQLSLTCRLSNQGPAEGIVSIAVNGTCVAQTTIGREWQALDINVGPDVVRSGLNEIAIKWPIPEFSGLKPLETVIDDLLDKFVPEFFHVFGEIHSFFAQAAVDQSQRASSIQEALAPR